MKQTKRTLVSLLLVLAMLATCLVAFSVTSSAAPATDLPTSWGATLPEGAVAWGQKIGDVDMRTASTSLKGTGEDKSAWGKTKDNPYLINNVADFMYFVTTMAEDEAATGNNFAGKYFKMTGDVYFPVITQEMINAKTRDFAPPTFAGNFDGNGHTIWNPRNGYAKYNAVSTVFGTLDGATVENLTVKGAFFANTAGDNAANAAGLASTMTGGTITNCHVVDAYLAGVQMGGLVCTASGSIKIENCSVTGGTFNPTASIPEKTPANTVFFGGIVGKADDTVIINNCENSMSGKQNEHAIDFGGIVAYNNATSLSIKNCRNYGSYTTKPVTGSVTVGAGGIVGRNYTKALPVFEDCLNYGDITAPYNCGGLIGRTWGLRWTPETVTILRCANYGAITATAANAGGFVGYLFGRFAGTTITAQDSANYGNIQAANCAGGYIGNLDLSQAQTSVAMKTDNFANYGSVTATNRFAGLVVGFYAIGKNGSATAPNISVTNSVLTGTVKAAACAGSICGGYAAYASGRTMYITVTGSYVDCTITAGGRSGVISGGWLSTDTADTNVTGAINDTTGLSLVPTDSKFNVTLNGATSKIGYYVADAGQTVSLTALGDAFSDHSAKNSLNTYASTNSLSEWVQGTKAPFLKIFATQVALDGATLSLNDTMTLKLFVKASSAAKIDGLKSIMVNDGTEAGNYEGTLDETGNYVFEISGLAAKDMGTAKTYTVKYTLASDTANPITCDTGVTYSPLQYAINMYQKNNGTDANFAALLTSMVRYMDAAGATGAMTTFETETKYAFASEDLATAYAEIMKKATEYTIPSDTMSLGAELTSGITLLVKPADGKTLTSVKIGTKELTIESAGTNTWRVNGLNPGDLYNELTFTFTTEEGTTEVTYSVARYLNNYVGTASETLAKATALYMDAFITYKTATN